MADVDAEPAAEGCAKVIVIAVLFVLAFVMLWTVGTRLGDHEQRIEALESPEVLE